MILSLRCDDIDVREICWVKNRFPFPKRIDPEHSTAKCAADWRHDGQRLCRNIEAVLHTASIGNQLERIA